VKVPAIELENRLGDISHLVGQVITPNDPLGQLAALSIDELVREKRDSVAAPLSQIVLDLLALSLGRTCTGAAPPVRMAQMRVTWAKATAIGQLRDPSLSVQSIADAQGVSLRLLQRLFAQEGLNLSRFILEQRLDRSRGDLINPYQACRSIAEIARSWGFNDAQYYSRAFRKRFGIAPKEYRHDNKQS
jgi:AraC-like DNA-binding protein